MRADGVVLLHGIFRTSRSLRRLERFLAANGYKTLNLDYPSTRYTIEEIAQLLHPAIDAFSREIAGKMHFVGYSMGGLVIRAYLHRFPMPGLGRVVMLATPNQGSEVADALKDRWLYKKLYGPAGQQLVTKRHGIVFKDVIRYELGVIAGNCTLDPVSSWMIGGVNDGKVSVASTRVDGMKEHIVIPATHTFFPASKLAWKHTLHFLETGGFAD